eukprot:TRINITY_DN74110_c0_g1_i1.p1 TRINITY_DN74110_c0_g1~~TRINITY_DN74110_c0_g1_i1.p1  ORF type:complete len:384 (+),score=79.57 TRINITY_DN74110_c0_g1_i1:246-1397(+)
MAAGAALNVVKQIQALADGPETPEMHECLGQVVSSLQFFLDHPDSRVRLTAARTLLKLARGYGESVAALDLTRAHASLARCDQALRNGEATPEDEELRGLLKVMLAGPGPEAGAPGDNEKVNRTCEISTSMDRTGSIPAAATGGTEERGEVVIKVGEGTDGKVKAAILDQIVGLTGVVSVTFEGTYVIVNTRTKRTAADTEFLADLLTALKCQGVHGAALVSANPLVAGPPPNNWGQKGGYGTGGFTGCTGGGYADGGKGQYTASNKAVPVVVDDDEEPGYLDDDEDEVIDAGIPGSGGAAGDAGMAQGNINGALGGRPSGLSGQQWSFFAQSNWMTGRRVQEFDDDPTIASRLRKAKQKDSDKRQAEKSRIGRLFSSLTGGR